MGTFVNKEGPDEKMPYSHLGLCYGPRQIDLQKKKDNNFLKTIT